MYQYATYADEYDELYHHGIKGQKWGVRRFQNKDMSLTPAGRARYQQAQRDASAARSRATNAWRKNARNVLGMYGTNIRTGGLVGAVVSKRARSAQAKANRNFEKSWNNMNDAYRDRVRSARNARQVKKEGKLEVRKGADAVALSRAKYNLKDAKLKQRYDRQKAYNHFTITNPLYKASRNQIGRNVNELGRDRAAVKEAKQAYRNEKRNNPYAKERRNKMLKVAAGAALAGGAAAAVVYAKKKNSGLVKNGTINMDQDRIKAHNARVARNANARRTIQNAGSAIKSAPGKAGRAIKSAPGKAGRAIKSAPGKAQDAYGRAIAKRQDRAAGRNSNLRQRMSQRQARKASQAKYDSVFESQSLKNRAKNKAQNAYGKAIAKTENGASAMRQRMADRASQRQARQARKASQAKYDSVFESQSLKNRAKGKAQEAYGRSMAKRQDRAAGRNSNLRQRMSDKMSQRQARKASQAKYDSVFNSKSPKYRAKNKAQNAYQNMKSRRRTQKATTPKRSTRPIGISTTKL